MTTPPRPATPTWTSPLKPNGGGQTHEPPLKSTARRSLFGAPEPTTESSVSRALIFDELDELDIFTPDTNPEKDSNLAGKEERDPAPTSESISACYEVEFFRIPIGGDVGKFFEIRELVLQIETFIYQERPTSVDIKELRGRIGKLLHSSSDHETKMGELGMILFYLDHPERPFPEVEESLVAFRADEIEAEVRSLVEQHEATCTNKLIPSGKTHYLIRAFAHMAMTSGQVYNKGGLYALLSILESQEYGVTKYLRAEHHEHILIVVRQVLANPAFVGLFKRQVAVHPDLQDAIRIDLKLKRDEHIYTTHVFWDCFMFLFSDIRQINRPNCYAIGALTYATENAPYKTVETMIAWLSQGYYAFNDHTSIPIAPLLAKRLIYTRDLQVELESQKALSLTTFQHISSTLSVTPGEESGSDDVVPLRSSLRTILDSGEASEHLPYAEKLYYAYKYSTLGHLALGVMEFAYMNCPETNRSTAEYSLTKGAFLNQVMRGIEDQLAYRLPRMDHTPLIGKIRQKLGERLWFENCSELDVHLDHGVVHVGGKEIRQFEGNRRSLVRVLQDSLRIFYLEGDRYVLLDSFSDLQQVISTLVDESVGELKRESRYDYTRSAESVKRHTTSYSFTSQLARHASTLIRQRGISGSNLRRANLLLFEQIGGCPNEVLQNVFGMQVMIQRVSGASTPYQFVERLIRGLRNLDETLFRATPRLLAFTLGSHIWTVSPNRLRLLFKPSITFYNFIQTSIFDAANTRMRSRIPEDTVNTVVDRVAGNNVAFKRQLQVTVRSIRNLTFERFRTTLLDSAPSRRKYNEIKEIIDDEFGKIRASEMNLAQVFEELHIDVPETVQLEIADAMGDKRMHPYQLAYAIRKLLIEHKVCVIDPYDLELAVCYAHNLPIAFDIGDLNWDEGEYREDPPHPHLVIRYNWANRTLSYYHRESDGERIQENREFERFEIQHPPVRTSRTSPW